MTPPANRFIQRLEDPRPLLLDGGLATQLETDGARLDTPLWSAALLRDAPDRIRAAHRAYREAGAEVLISASYQASREGFLAQGTGAGEADRLLARSVALARDEAGRSSGAAPLVAASVGPWGAARHDGSEYTGRYAVDEDELAAFHVQRLAVLDAAGADVLACETLPNQAEVTVLAALLQRVRTPAWVSFCCRDEESLSDGTPIEDAAAPFVAHPRVAALGINCTAPRFVTGLLERLRRAAPGLPVLVYPNSGEQYDAGRNRWEGQEDPFATMAREWLAAGARGVGGCCRVGPAHIRALARLIDEEAAP